MIVLAPARLTSAVTLSLLVCLGATAAAQSSSPRPAVGTAAAVHGVATTQGRTVRLPGVTVTVKSQGAQTEPAVAVTDGDGAYRVIGLPAGPAVVTFALDGFDTATATVTIAVGQDAELNADLEIAKVTEQLEVVQQSYAEPMAMSLGSRQVLDERAMESPSFAGTTIDAALSMLAGVVFGPEGLSIRGGRPSQSVMLLGGTDMADASVGTTRYQLPSEAVSTVEVLPNPYAVEFGRFSSGVTIVNTRRGTDQWRGTINNLEPGFWVKRGTLLQVGGVKVFAPHATFGGPLIKDRLFLAQTNSFDYRTWDIRSRPDNQRASQTVFTSFTRLDANLSPGHTATLTLGIFPETHRSVNLDTFTPPASAFDVTQRVYSVGLSDTRTLSATSVVETSAQLSRYGVQVGGDGQNPMVVQPQGVSGSYFNSQGRQTYAFQWLGSISEFKQNWAGEHLFKAGADLLYSTYDGESASLPVEARRSDGTLARRVVFGPASHVDISGTDLGLFLQDRWRPVSRLLLEMGARVDRDGTLGRANFTPRSGVALLLKSDGSITLRGGAGLFYERTPLFVSAFPWFEQRTETRYAADGITPLGLPVVFTNTVTGPLQTPGAFTWNVEYSHHLNTHWSFRASHLERDGSHELIVDPVVNAEAGTGQLLLSSTGRSAYRETEVSARYSPNRDFEISAAYVRSRSNADLNNYSAYFGAERNPFIGSNEYGPAPSDVPNRVVVRTRAMLGEKWSFASFGEVREGFPYSAVNSAQDFVGPRNESGRFPALFLVDVALERKIKLWKWTPWVGVKIMNALDAFTPIDVQRNVDSVFYGSFYNAIPRQFRLTLRIN